jgi:hypothetical protein
MKERVAYSGAADAAGSAAVATASTRTAAAAATAVELPTPKAMAVDARVRSAEVMSTDIQEGGSRSESGSEMSPHPSKRHGDKLEREDDGGMPPKQQRRE